MQKLNFTVKNAIIQATDESSQKPFMDWDDWIKQYPKFSRKKAVEVMEKYKRLESECYFNQDLSPEINWDEWKKTIKTPGLVEHLKAEYEATDHSNYGPFYYDDLIDSEKALILSSDSPYSQEIDAIGRRAVINGVEETLKKDLKKRIDSARELTEKSALRLEELYKDREQRENRTKRAGVQSYSELLAEYPGLAREMEENLSGGPVGAGFVLNDCDYQRLIAISKEREDWRDREFAEKSLRWADEEIEEYLAVLERMGLEISKKEFIANKFDERQAIINELRDYCRETRSINSEDPKTGEPITEEIEEGLVEIRGGG